MILVLLSGAIADYGVMGLERVVLGETVATAVRHPSGSVASRIPDLRRINRAPTSS